MERKNRERKKNLRVKKRFVDGGYGAGMWDVMNTGIAVRCPTCNGLGVVKGSKNGFRFQCQRCARQLEKTETSGKAEGCCQNCGRFFRVQIEHETQRHFRFIRVCCPYCQHPQRVELQNQPSNLILFGIRHCADPYFGLDLYYQTSVHGKVVWASCREHLLYLIDLLEAHLREDRLQPDGHRWRRDRVPEFMKRAKNRDVIVKRLKRLLRT